MHYHPSTFFFFNDTATTEIYTLSLHDALPICRDPARGCARTDLRGASLAAVAIVKRRERGREGKGVPGLEIEADRKSTRLNSSHSQISYAVFCLKKKKTKSVTDTEYVRIMPQE